MFLNCTFHKTERETLINSIKCFLQTPITEFTEKELFIAIMKMKFPEALNAIGKYIYVGFNRRRNFSTLTS